MEGEEKLENQLNLALELSRQEREKTLDLNVGYDEESDRWEVIFQYAGDLSDVEVPEGAVLESLGQGYGIAYLPADFVEEFAALPQIIYVEKPKNLLLERESAIAASCMLSVRMPPFSLSGSGVYVAVIDTGIDIFHPDFIDELGNTKIAVLWDQTLPGNPSEAICFWECIYERRDRSSTSRCRWQTDRAGYRPNWSWNSCGVNRSRKSGRCAGGGIDCCEAWRDRGKRISKNHPANVGVGICYRICRKTRPSCGSQYQLRKSLWRSSRGFSSGDIYYKDGRQLEKCDLYWNRK